MDWDLLRIFYHVAKAGSLTLAGEYLHTSHSALSRSVKLLEDRFGAKLFNRHSRGLILTKNGEILLSHVKKMLLEIDTAREHILGHSDTLHGSLKLTMTLGFASTVLFKHLCNFLILYPNIHLDIICNDENLDLTYREADVAIRPYDPNDNELAQEFLKERTLGLYASKNYLDNFGIPNEPNDLKNHRLILYENKANFLPYTYNRWFLTLINQPNYTLKPFMSINSTECMVQAAQKGLGIITLSHDSSLIKEANLIRVLPYIDGPTSKMYFVYLKSIEKLKIIKLLYEYLRSCFKLEP